MLLARIKHKERIQIATTQSVFIVTFNMLPLLIDNYFLYTIKQETSNLYQIKHDNWETLFDELELAFAGNEFSVIQNWSVWLRSQRWRLLHCSRCLKCLNRFRWLQNVHFFRCLDILFYACVISQTL